MGTALFKKGGIKMEYKNIFDVKTCAEDVIKVLEKHHATFANMKEVFKLVKKVFH